MLLTGIASPEQMEFDLQKHFKFTSVHFSDHHEFQQKDIELLQRTVKSVKAEGKQTIVITTEKDAARLLPLGKVYNEFTLLNYQFPLYVLPVEVDFMDNGAEIFNQFILGYVQKNSRNSTLLRKSRTDKA